MVPIQDINLWNQHVIKRFIGCELANGVTATLWTWRRNCFLGNGSSLWTPPPIAIESSRHFMALETQSMGRSVPAVNQMKRQKRTKRQKGIYQRNGLWKEWRKTEIQEKIWKMKCYPKKNKDIYIRDQKEREMITDLQIIVMLEDHQKVERCLVTSWYMRCYNITDYYSLRDGHSAAFLRRESKKNIIATKIPCPSEQASERSCMRNEKISKRLVLGSKQESLKVVPKKSYERCYGMASKLPSNRPMEWIGEDTIPFKKPSDD